MKLLNEIRFLTVSTLVFMAISLFAVFYLFFYENSPNNLGNKEVQDENLLTEQAVYPHHDDRGRTLFKSNCARCHYVTEQRMIGPGLKGVMNRINEEQLISWVHDPAKTRKKDPYFAKLFDEFGEQNMPAFPTLKKEEILSIIEYVNAVADGEYEVMAMVR
jgi:cytochrome c551/c552